MGRWSQRQRGGGGQSITLKEMSGANAASASIITVNYTGAVTAAAFTPTNFHTQPSNTPGFSIVQDGPTGIDIDFLINVSTDDTITYTGTTAGFKTPDSTDIT